MVEKRDILWRFLGDSKSLQKSTKGGTQSLGKMQKASGVATKAVGALGLALGAQQLGRQIGQAVSAASDFDESVNAVEVTTGDAAAEIIALGDAAASAFGLSKIEVNEAAVAFAAFGEKIDQDGNIADTFEEFIGRATDFASVMNISVGEAIEKFQSGLAGESEPLRRFGLDLSAASVGAFAVANGISESTAKMTEAEKVQARYGLLMKQTSKTAGDFANTSDSLANATKTATAEWKNAQIEIGRKLVPVMGEMVIVGRDLIPVIVTIAEEAADTAIEIVAMVKPILDVVAAAGGLINTLDDARDSGDLFAAAIETGSEVLKNVALFGLPIISEKYNEFQDAANEAANAVSDLTKTQLEAKRPWAQTTEFVIKAATGIKRVARRSREAADGIRSMTSAVLEQSDPVFAAVAAAGRFADTLARIDEDGHRSAEEMLELAAATAEAGAAMDAVDGVAINASLQLLTDRLGISEGAARDLLIQLGILAGLPSFNIGVVGPDLPSGLGAAIGADIAAGFADAAADAIRNSMAVAARKAAADATVRPIVPESFLHAGGVVPGGTGRNVPTVLQGGERVIPRGQSGGGGINLTVNMGVVGDPDGAAQAIADLLTQYEIIDGTRRSGIV